MSQWDVPGLLGGKSTESLKPWETEAVKAPGNGTQEASVEESHRAEPW